MAAKKRRPRPRNRSTLGETSNSEDLFAQTEREEQEEKEMRSQEAKNKKRTTASKPKPKKKKPAKKKGASKAKERTEEAWRGKNRSRSLDSFMRDVVDTCKKEEGMDGLLVAGEASVLIGLPWPSFCLEWLFDNDVIPLSRYMNVIGPPGTCKTAFLFELFRIFRACDGGAAYFENETKFADDFCRSIMRYPARESVIVLPSQSMDHWQGGFQLVLAKLKEKFIGTKAKPGPGKIVPMVLAIDSLMGKMTMEIQDKVEKEGSLPRAHPVEASSLKNFMGTIPGRLADWPFLLVTTNHLKPKRNEATNRMEDHQPGGESPRFQEAFEVKMSPGPQSRIDTLDKRGRRLNMHVTKNSHGQDQRKILTRFLWWDEYEEDGNAKQQSVWDWHWATIYLLGHGHKKKWGETERKRIHEVVDVRISKLGGDGRAWSKTLGVKSAEKAVPFSELGAMLHEREDLKEELRKRFGIKRRKVFVPNMDYGEQRDIAIEQVRRRE